LLHHEACAGPRRRLIKRLYYGWFVVAALAVTETISYGVLYYAFAAFIGPMHADTGWSQTQITAALSVALAVSGLAAVPIGHWLDRHGARGLMTMGSVLATAGVFAWSRAHSLPGLYLVWAVLGVAMAAVLYEPAFTVLTVWFERRRVRAITVLTLIAGLSSVIFVPLAEHLVASQGWRMAAVTLAVILGVGTVLPHALVLRKHPANLGLVPDGAPPPATHVARPSLGMANVSLVPITAAFALANFASVAVSVHLILLLTEAGHTPAVGSFAAAAVGVAALPGRAIFTPLGARISKFRVAAIIFAFQATGVLALHSKSEVAIPIFVLLFGAGFGALSPARASLTADVAGAARFGRVNGGVTFYVTAARAAAPACAAAIHDWTGHYTAVIWLLSGGCILAALLLIYAERGSEAGRHP
jgi:MFS family permease